MLDRIRAALHRLGLRLLHRRRLLIIQNYESVFANEEGEYQQDRCEEFCKELDTAGIDYLLMPRGLEGLYDDGRGQVVPIGGESRAGWYDRA